MTVQVRKWLEDTSEWLFKYALDYFLEVEFPIAPKLHTIDSKDRVAIVSCDFWEEDEAMNYEQLGAALDKIIDSLDAVAYVFLFVGKVNNIEAICTINGDSVSKPIFCYKPILRCGSTMDFGPLRSISHRDVESLEF